jgi:hypothetical protein
MAVKIARAPAPATVIISGSLSEISAASDDDNSPSRVKTKSTAHSRELFDQRVAIMMTLC